MWDTLRTVNFPCIGKPLEEPNRKMTWSDSSSRNICGILVDNQLVIKQKGNSEGQAMDHKVRFFSPGNS